MIRALLCDLGNVLVYFSHERMVEQIAALSGRDTGMVRRVLFDGTLLHEYETGQLDTENVRDRLECDLDVEFSDLSTLVEAASDIFWSNDAIVPIIEQLAKRDFPMAMISNTSPVHRDWVEARFPVFRLFKHHCLSYEVRSAKPDRLIFDKACEMVGCGPSDCLFVDDTPANIAAAQGYGFHTLKFEDVQELETLLTEGPLHD